MATTKQAEREQTESLLAEEYLADLIYFALLEHGEAAKVSEITAEINNPRIRDLMVRRVVSSIPRFLLVGRLWDLSARFLDRSYSTERNLNEVLVSAGRPLSIAQLATELSTIYERGSEVYLQMLPRILSNSNVYFKTTSNEFGLRNWLPVTDAEELDDVFADNAMRKVSVQPYLAASEKVRWTPERYAEATLRLVDAAKRPLPHRLLGVLAWLTLREKYNPTQHFSNCFSDSRLVWLTSKQGGRWISRTQVDRLEALLDEQGRILAEKEGLVVPEPEPPVAPVIFPAVPVRPEPEVAPEVLVTRPTIPEEAPMPDAVPERPIVAPEPPVDTLPVLEPEPEPLPQPPVVEVEDVVAPVEEPVVAPEPSDTPEVMPLQISADDLAFFENLIVGRETPLSLEEMLRERYQVLPGDPAFEADKATLFEALRQDLRFLYVGADRFREPDSLPIFVYEIPEFLTFPDLQFISMDGEIMDEEIEDEGFVGTLRSELLNPLVQDAGDDEGRYTGTQSAEAASIRLVVKAHHKDIGTFPLCQVPDGFFPTDTPVAEVVVTDPNGESHSLIVSNEARLVFNLFGLYEFLTADSGGVFLLHRTERAYEYRFEAEPENDPQVFITPNRMAELLALREQAEETGDMATFDIACEVLAHYNKGLDFVQAMSEINVVRRVTRRKLASILSFYQCFVQRPGQPQWRFDAKKRDLGTDRAKRKYIKR